MSYCMKVDTLAETKVQDYIAWKYFLIFNTVVVKEVLLEV